MDNVVIEPERPEDAEAITEVVRQAFAHQPGVAEMAASDLVTRSGERHEVLTLTPLAVDPDCQRREIGAALVRAALRTAENSAEPLIVLEGSPHYYGRLGFYPAAGHGITITLPDWAPPAAAQVLLLRAHGPHLQGHIEYPSAIAAVSG
jgi:putative acetyltransferase